MKRELTLNNNLKIPILGFGTWQLEKDKAYQAVKTALEVGYTHIDTADKYYNHAFIKDAIKESQISREKLFITSKIWRDEFEKDKVRIACQRMLKELELDYLDLFLLHWPNKDVPIGETLEAMQKIKEEGLVKSIGVSNFTINHLKDILKTGMYVAVNQVEFHPSLYQKDLKDFCDQNNIILTAYSPIAQGKDFEIPVIQSLAKKYQRSESQIILNWLMQKGIVVIPKASSRAHITDNFHSLEFDLDTEDCALIDAVNTNTRIINPDFGEFAY